MDLINSSGNKKKRKSTTSCVAYGCKNLLNEESHNKGITFHRFPMSKPDRVAVWEHAVRRQGFRPTKWSRICSSHFKAECFDRTGQTVRLREDAVPTEFPNYPQHLQKAHAQLKRRTSHHQAEDSENHDPNNFSIQASRLNSGSDHPYALSSPGKSKRQLGETLDTLDLCRKRLKTSQQRTRRLSKKVSTLEGVIKNLRDKNLMSQQGTENLSNSFSGPALKLIERYLKQGTSSCREAYPPEVKAFALTLQFYSGRAYEYVRETFAKCLPDQRTLSRWYSCVNGRPGFHNEIFEALHAKAQETDRGRLVCAFMMDEVAIRKQLDYDRTSDMMVGYVDMGVEISDMGGLPLAHEALVFLIVSLTDSWKIPVAYFLTAGLNGKEKGNLVKMAIEKLYEVGVDVVSITCDGCSGNFSMAEMLGASLNVTNPRPFFPHPRNPEHQICIFLDACHMLKLMRNTLADKQVLLNNGGKRIEWNYIKRLQALQFQEGLHAANRLNERHINWTKQKMKVNLAAQTLSSSVADALEFCRNELRLPEFQGCMPTVEFIRVIDRLFDLLNSRNPIAKGYKAPMRTSNESYWRPFCHTALQYLQGLKLADGQPLSSSLRKTGVVGFTVSVQSALFLFDSLVKQQSVLKYILTYKVSQDHLELFFAALRSRGGNNNNPSAAQLRATWKRLLTHNHVKDIATGNCLPQDNCRLLSISNTIHNININDGDDIDSISLLRQTPAENDTLHEDHDYYPKVNTLSPFVDNVVVYIAGFVVRSLQKITCAVCKESLASRRLPGDVTRTDLGLLQLKDRGGLVTPSDDVITICKASEKCIRRVTASNLQLIINKNVSTKLVIEILGELVGVPVFEVLRGHALETVPENNHQVTLMRSVAAAYIRIRLYHQCKVVTRVKQGDYCRSVCSKLPLFKGQ